MSKTQRKNIPHYFRKPRTANEARAFYQQRDDAAEALDCNARFQPSARRAPRRTLPDAYDDRPVAALREIYTVHKEKRITPHQFVVTLLRICARLNKPCVVLS